jgi:hypothetical protein
LISNANLVADPWEALRRKFVRARVVVRQPAGRVDAVEHVVGNVEGDGGALAAGGDHPQADRTSLSHIVRS